MKKVVIADIIVILLILSAGIASYYLLIRPNNENAPRAAINPEKPVYESVLTKSREDFGSEKEYALYLYQQANFAFQQSDSSIDDYLTKTTVGGVFSISSQGCRFTVKKDTEYYYADYSGVTDGMEGLMDLTHKTENTQFAVISYVDIASMDYLYTEKSLRPKVEIDEDGVIKVEANWSDGNIVNGYPKHEEVPVFHSSQTGLFEQTEMRITLDTIAGATVTYNPDLQYYTVTFSLDVKNPVTTEKTIGNLQAGLAGATYESITKVYQIWDNGYFRQAESLDLASNSAMGLKLDFKTYFKYTEKECDPNNYRYFDYVKQKALAELK